MNFIYVWIYGMLIFSMIVQGCQVSLGAKITALNFSNDGKSLAVGLINGSAVVLEIKRELNPQEIVLMQEKITAIELDGDLLVAGSSNGLIAFKDLRTNSCNVKPCHKGAITAIKSAGYFIVTGSDDKTVCVLNRTTGVLLRKIELPGPVTSLEIVGDKANTILIGCANGIICCYEIEQSLLWQLFSCTKEGAITCLRNIEKGFFACFQSGQILLFNELYKPRRVYKAPAVIAALQICFQGLVVIGVGTKGMLEYWWDSSFCDLIKQIQNPSQDAGSVAINEGLTAYGFENKLVLRPIDGIIRNIEIENGIGGFKLQSVDVTDGFGRRCGHLDTVNDEDSYCMNLHFRSNRKSNGNFILFNSRKGDSFLYFFPDPLLLISKILLSQDLLTGRPNVRYGMTTKNGSSAPYYFAQPQGKYSQNSFEAAPVNAVLYSVDTKIIGARLGFQTEEGSSEQISGSSLSDKGFVWFFKHPKAKAPFMLSLWTDRGCYAWSLPCLSDQSELFLTKVLIKEAAMAKVQSMQRWRPTLVHVCEQAGAQEVYHFNEELSLLDEDFAWKPFFANKVRMKYNIPLSH